MSPPPNHISTKLNYLVWQPKYAYEKPYEIASRPDSSSHSLIPTTNLVFSSNSPELVHDVRGTEHLYSLDTHGFLFRKGPESDFRDFYDRKRVERDYLPKVVQPWLEATVEGANRVAIFDWHVCSLGQI